MPYELIRRGDKWAVKNKNTGRNHGWTTREKAARQLRLLRALDNRRTTR